MVRSSATPLGDEHEASGMRRLRWPRICRAAVAWMPLAVVICLALWVNASSLSRAGYGNTYYAAAVRSMTMSWKNFFFGAFDPGGFITVDKPPVFLWVDAAAAHVFGYSSWSLLLPSAMAGAATVALLWLIVHRWFGVMAATIAAAVLALTPITVAVDRLNLPEPFYILALVGAAACLLRSLETRRWVLWVAAAGMLVGIAFNTKMLAAWIPGPAFALALVVGIRRPWLPAWKQLAARLTVLAVATLVVSLSWLLVVDAWPAAQRPFVGGSSDDTVANLALGYNGIGRVTGGSQPGSARGRVPPSPRVRPNASSSSPRPPISPQNRVGAAPPPRATGGGVLGAGGVIAGQPGWLRMFDSANAGQIAWFLPFALLGGLLLLSQSLRDPPRRAFAALWLGWVVLFAGVFSFTHGIYHSYYTAAIAPGIASLVGAGATSVVPLLRRHWSWVLVPVAIVAVTMWVQLLIAGSEPGFYGWVWPFTVATAIAGILVLMVSRVWRIPPAFGIVLSITGLLLLPASWSWHEAAHTSMNATLPQAGPRQGLAASTFGSQAFDNGTTSLSRWLQVRRDPNARWDLAVMSAQNASTMIAQDGLSVMALGGFSGTDPVISTTRFADLVAIGEVRYVLAGGGGSIPRAPRGFGGNPLGGPGINNGVGSALRTGALGTGQLRRPVNPLPALPPPGAAPAQQSFSGRGGSSATAVLSAVRIACTAVHDPSLPAQYRDTIYDCAGQAVALRVASRS